MRVCVCSAHLCVLSIRMNIFLELIHIYIFIWDTCKTLNQLITYSWNWFSVPWIFRGPSLSFFSLFWLCAMMEMYVYLAYLSIDDCLDRHKNPTKACRVKINDLRSGIWFVRFADAIWIPKSLQSYASTQIARIGSRNAHTSTCTQLHITQQGTINIV